MGCLSPEVDSSLGWEVTTFLIGKLLQRPCNTWASEKIALRSLFEDPDWEFTDISGISPSCLDRAEAYGLGHKFRPHP